MKIVKEAITCERGALTISGTLFKPADTAGLPTAVVCHEFMATQRLSYSYARVLAECGYAAFCFDFCGGSKASKSDGDTRDMSVLTEVEDLKSVIACALSRDDTDGQTLLLAGCSQGGLVAALAAAELQEKVTALLLLYPALCIPEDARKGRMLSASFDPENIPNEIPCGSMLLGRCYPEAVMGMDVYEEITKYTGRVLIIHGDADRVVDLSYARKAAKAYREAGADVHLKVIRDGAHVFRKPSQIRRVKRTVGAYALRSLTKPSQES